MEDYITRPEHEEFSRRMEDEHKRQNRRIGALEETVREIGQLTSSVEKLAINMENMLHNQEHQGERLEVLEARDGKRWRKVADHVITTIVGIILGFIFTRIGM